VTQALMSTGAMTFERSALAQACLHELIPGGAHTYARGFDQYPEGMTPMLVRGRGARVEDLHGNWLIEYGMSPSKQWPEPWRYMSRRSRQAAQLVCLSACRSLR